MKKNQLNQIFLLPADLLKQENKFVENFTQNLFNLIEWLIVIATLKFIYIRTGNGFIRFIEDICFIFWMLYLAKLLFRFVLNIFIRFFIPCQPTNLDHHSPDTQILPIFITFIISGLIGIISTLAVLRIVNELMVSL